MPEGYFERLSAMDTSFLILEKPSSPLHVSATLIYEAGPMSTAAGGVDIDAFKSAIRAVLPRVPRYRQKLKWIPVWNQPVWIDDRQFNLDYHIRHTSLPRPGTDRQLKLLAAAFKICPKPTEQQLDAIASRVGMEAETLAHWFQSRRVLQEWVAQQPHISSSSVRSMFYGDDEGQQPAPPVAMMPRPLAV